MIRWQRTASSCGDDMDGVAMEHRRGKIDVGHAEISDRGAQRGVRARRSRSSGREVNSGVDQGLAEFGFSGEMEIDVQGLRVEGHVGKQHVVHLRDRPR